MPNNLYIPLENRSIISISGSDNGKFLQGLITNDIKKCNEQRTIYALMLTPQGKFLYDFFISKLDEQFLLDCNTAQLAEIIKKLQMYKLRSNVVIEDRSNEYEVISIIGTKVFKNLGSMEPGYTKKLPEGIIYIDPRSTNLYARVIL